MEWYFILSGFLIFTQFFFMFYIIKNHCYLRSKAKRVNGSYLPSVLLTVPCKGIDSSFEKNIKSFFELNYADYGIHFVVESSEDLAYSQLKKICIGMQETSKAKFVEILIAGKAVSCGQKNHNLLYSIEHCPDHTEVLAFADSDACVKVNWLEQLVYPLRKESHGASTGYRWFVPLENNFATLMLSSLNAKVAQLLGKSRFNQAWGGSMAIKKTTFYKIGLDSLWSESISDDLSLSYAIKKNKMKIVFCPACLVASYEKTNWNSLCEFTRRQFIITKVMTPSVWFFGLFSSFYSFLGVWGTLFAGVCVWGFSQKLGISLFAISVTFLLCQLFRAILRQKLMASLLPEDKKNMKVSAFMDFATTTAGTALMLALFLSTAVGRTICWRGIRYKLIGPEKTEIVDLQQ